MVLDISDGDTFYEMFMNNDKGFYTKPGDSKPIDNSPLLLNPFKFLYTLDGDKNNPSWLGLKDTDSIISSLMIYLLIPNNLAKYC